MDSISHALKNRPNEKMITTRTNRFLIAALAIIAALLQFAPANAQVTPNDELPRQGVFDPAVELVRKLVNAFYTTGFSFGQFIKAHPQHLGNLTDLLIGRIFHPDAGGIFRDMAPWLEKAKTQDESA